MLPEYVARCSLYLVCQPDRPFRQGSYNWNCAVQDSLLSIVAILQTESFMFTHYLVCAWSQQHTGWLFVTHAMTTCKHAMNVMFAQQVNNQWATVGHACHGNVCKRRSACMLTGSLATSPSGCLLFERHADFPLCSVFCVCLDDAPEPVEQCSAAATRDSHD